MSLGPEMIGTVNTTTRNAQTFADNATNAGGESVVVWEDQLSSIDEDIRAQRYNSFGGKIGPEIAVAVSGLNETSPHVALNDQGQFVVSYTQSIAGDTNVVAQRFDSNGNAVGGLIQVGAGTFAEGESDVAIDRAGNFAVSYTRNTNNNNPDIFAKQYSSSGQLLNVVNVATSLTAESHSSIAMTPDGRFDVAWEQVFGPTDRDIYLRRYSASGGLLGTNTVAFSTALDETPSVAMDNAGDAVVAWDKNRDIKAMRIGAAGSQGPEINIASAPAVEADPSVALKPGGGGFVVAYDTVVGPTVRVKVAEVSAFDTVTTIDAGELRSGPAVSFDAFGDYLLTYTSSDASFDQNIRARRGLLQF